MPSAAKGSVLLSGRCPECIEKPFESSLNKKQIKMKTTRSATKIRRSPARQVLGAERRLRAHTATVTDELGYEPEPHMKLSRALFIVVLMHVVVIAGLFGFQSLRERAGTTRPDLAAENYPRTTTASGVDDVSTARIHYVRANETLTSIAAYYNVPLKDLATANSIVDASQIMIGQELKIPLRSAQAPKPLDIDNITAMTRTATAPVTRPASQEIRSRPKPTPATSKPNPTVSSDTDNALRQQFLETKQGKTSSDTATLKEQFLEAKSQTVPVAELATPATKSPADKPKAVSNTAVAQRQYVVEKGDNPVAIAKRFNVNYTNLLKANNISDPRKLQVGQKLIIPRD